MSERRTSLLLVRHGQTPWNAAGRWQGHADPGLSELGRDQAAELAAALRHELEGGWARIVSSDLRRARETAGILADSLGLAIETDARLRELDVGAWTGLTRSEIEARDLERLTAFESGEPTIRAGGGETRLEIRLRARALVGHVAERHAGQRLIVVTHLGVIRALLPGVEPGNTDRYPVVAEEILARPIDHERRAERGAL
ncbi:MAG: histidine phosphatase family protein [Deltaproteobacteria bacterium]|jgi:probable phosphoglycerate mutase|nr:histidine phosphatase family protein [Deltaproteobacteria bacterium]